MNKLIRINNWINECINKFLISFMLSRIKLLYHPSIYYSPSLLIVMLDSLFVSHSFFAVPYSLPSLFVIPSRDRSIKWRKRPGCMPASASHTGCAWQFCETVHLMLPKLYSRASSHARKCRALEWNCALLPLQSLKVY